jgi:hypothetical protein
MEYEIDRKGAERIVDEYMQNEMMEYRKTSDRELERDLAPEAKEAFNRKPYVGYTAISFKMTHYVRPVIKAHA